jgi:hypothetical protein
LAVSIFARKFEVQLKFLGKIGLLPPFKYMDFIFFPENALKKLLKFSEF